RRRARRHHAAGDGRRNRRRQRALEERGERHRAAQEPVGKGSRTRAAAATLGRVRLPCEAETADGIVAGASPRREVHDMLRAIACAAATVLLLASNAAQAAWPERAVTVVTPYAAGGIADVVARLTAERLQSGLKNPFVVENQPGASGIAAPERVSKSTPDGYT